MGGDGQLGVTGDTRAMALIESALDCIVTMDAEGRVIDFNPAAQATFGYTLEQARGRSLGDLIVPSRLRAVHERGLARHLATGERRVLGRRIEIAGMRSDGTELPVELTITRMDTAAGPLFTGFMRDLTETHRARAAVAEAEQRFRTLVEQVPTVTYICDYDASATHRYISPQVEELTGYPASCWLEDPGHWRRILHPEDRERVVAAIAEGVRTEVPFDCEYRMVRSDGRIVSVWDRETIVRDGGGRAVTSQGVILDVTALRSAEQALETSEGLHRSVVEALEEGVVLLDAEGAVAACNSSGGEILGFDPAAIIGRKPPLQPIFLEDGTPVDHRNSPTQEAVRTRRSVRDLLLRIVRPDGDLRWLSVNYEPLGGGLDGAWQGLVWSFSDVSERRHSEQRIAELAYRDALTGLANRAQLDQQLGPMLARARRDGGTAALVFLGLDRFKLVNESLGQAAGDELLREVALRLASRVRAGDLLVRRGGDEFALLLLDLGPEARDTVSSIAHDLVAGLEAPFRIQGAELELGATLGIALYPDDGDGAEQLLKHAEAALHAAKRGERGTVGFYERGGDDDAARRLSLSARLRRALERDELLLHHQPLFALATGRLVGVEALVRWEDPERGLVPPGAFIPLAEEMGLIERIGEWVIEAAVAQARPWLAIDPELMVGVNVSPRQLHRPGFAGRVAASLAGGRVDPQRLVVEITESAAMGDPRHVGPALAELHELGIHLAIDDFGAGFSSLNRLRSIPVDTLKIDRSFLDGVPGSPKAGAMVTAIVELAQALGMRTVAEGVETEAQRQFLLESGCAFGQGFHLARPMPAAAVTELLETASSRDSSRPRAASPVSPS